MKLSKKLMEEEKFFNLLDKITGGNADENDLALFNHEMNRMLDNTQPLELEKSHASRLKSKIWTEIQSNIAPSVSSNPKWKWAKIGIAASILLAIGAILWTDKNPKPTVANVIVHSDRKPDLPSAILQLSNGKRINLSASATGLIHEDANLKISQDASRLIVFQYSKQKNRRAHFDTLTTSSASIYHVKLTDGTILAINAGSSVRFPEDISTGERTVEVLKGEVYFDVVHNPNNPFRVKTGKSIIRDIGTRFAVKAATAQNVVEAIVEEGIVLVDAQGKKALLKTGMAGSLSKQAQSFRVYSPNIAEAIDWKDNLFKFEDQRLEQIMAEIGEWYGIAIKFEDGSLKNKQFSGIVPRSKKLSEILEMLATTGGIRFTIEKKIILINH